MNGPIIQIPSNSSAPIDLQPHAQSTQCAAINNQRTTETSNTALRPKKVITIQGLRKFDAIIDKCTAKQFEDIVNRLKGQLLADLRKSRKDFRRLAIRLLVLGEDETSARPQIIVFCPADVSEVVKCFFQQDFVRHICQPKQPGRSDFPVVVEGLPLCGKASRKSSPVTVTLGRPNSQDRKYWSTRIKVEQQRGCRYATMGGLIIVVDKAGNSSLHGLTAGHVFD